MNWSASGRPATRLYIPEPLAAGASVPLADRTCIGCATCCGSRPAQRSLPSTSGTANGYAEIDRLRRSHGALKAIEQRRSPEPGPDVWPVFAPIKRARLEWLVEKATELGVAALVPVMTARTQSERANRERLRVIAVAASEQSERISLPEIRPEVPLTRLLADWPADRRLIRATKAAPANRWPRRSRGPTGQRRRRRLSARRADLPKRSLTLSANSPLLRESGLARGYCARRPPPLPRWRFIRRSPATGGAFVGAEAGKFIVPGVSGAACLGRRACKDRRSPTSGS